MTDRISTLKQLQQRIRDSSGPHDELDCDIAETFFPTRRWRMGEVPHYTLDPDGLGACVALLDAVLPGTLWSVWDMEDGPGCRLLSPGRSGGYHDGTWSETDPVLWKPPTICAAMIDCIIAAYISELEAKQTEKTT